MKYLLIAVVVLSAAIFSLEAFAEQKSIFCSETYKHGSSSEESCQDGCSKKCDLNGLIADGWKIDTNMPREIIEQPSHGDGKMSIGCTCIGTQYVLSKTEKKVEVAPGTDNSVEVIKKEVELLKKENEMLKKENQMLTKENEVLKKENDARKVKKRK